jgi:hypothetical protein
MNELLAELERELASARTNCRELDPADHFNFRYWQGRREAFYVAIDLLKARIEVR